MRNLKLWFCVAVLWLAVFQFSENTVDPDLWGHVVFGQHMLQHHSIPKVDIYSWTANGQPWINHEWVAEIMLALFYTAWGGSGILLLKMAVGLASFAVCLRLGAQSLAWPARFVAWAFAALAVVEISYGFAARPQIFTALFMSLELLLLQQIHSGKRLWTLALPVLFLVWVNTHGGVLAGFGLLGLAAGSTTMQLVWDKIRKVPGAMTATGPDPSGWKTVLSLWLAVIAAGAALLGNPWGAGLIRWLIGSVLWLRPQIAEWNPTPLNWDHAAFFIVLALAAFSWVFTKQKRAWWELAVCGAFALLGLRAIRNTPLFCLVALALVSPHLASALARFRRHLEHLEALGRRAGFQKTATVLLAVISAGIAVATFTLHKEHPLTMEVPRSQYPVGAVDFLREHQLHGRTLAFFDWGEMQIFRTPDCPPSIDGRLDTCYPRELIDAHWKFYNHEPFDGKVLDVDRADLALLPANLAGTTALAHRPGWSVIYYDDLAVILARDAERFPELRGLSLPVAGSRSAVAGRAPFPNHSARWKTE
ncbi:MAG TPA: hypothetical protein VG077_18545 [Verrucomicrobiae bacterium]|nr:hypothetical protein [Verrucomicrobiae bacterium]